MQVNYQFVHLLETGCIDKSAKLICLEPAQAYLIVLHQAVKMHPSAIRQQQVALSLSDV